MYFLFNFYLLLSLGDKSEFLCIEIGLFYGNIDHYLAAKDSFQLVGTAAAGWGVTDLAEAVLIDFLP